MIGIYKITNTINNKIYIGQSKNIKHRFQEHKNIKKEHNLHLKKAYKKYGIENFKYEILEECKLEELDEKEIYWISKLKPEYNMNDGGKGNKGHKVKPEIKLLLKEKGKIFWNNLDEETKNKIIKNNLKDHKKDILLGKKQKKNLDNVI